MAKFNNDEENFILYIRSLYMVRELSKLELIVTERMILGMSTKCLCKKLEISPRTLEKHRISALDKMGLRGVEWRIITSLLFQIYTAFLTDYSKQDLKYHLQYGTYQNEIEKLLFEVLNRENLIKAKKVYVGVNE